MSHELTQPGYAPGLVSVPANAGEREAHAVCRATDAQWHDRPYQLAPLRALSATELRVRLSQAASAFRSAGMDAYTAYRDILLPVSLALNERQEWAPRFRGLPTLPAAKSGPEGVRYLMDLQIIDLHWRANSTRRPTVRLNSLFLLPFDFALAEHEAARGLPMPVKVLDLGLTPTMQLDHAVLQADALRDKWRSISRGRVRADKILALGVPQVSAILQEVAYRQPRLSRFIDGWVTVWTAARLVGAARPKEIARLVGLMTGERAPDRSATAKKLIAVTRHIDEFMRGR
jgi:hypothetical protein